MTKEMDQVRGCPWGMRRADGMAWKTEEDFDGDADFYLLGSDVTKDAMIVTFPDMYEFVTEVLRQRANHPDLTHSGEVVPMRVNPVTREYEDMLVAEFHEMAYRVAEPKKWMLSILNAGAVDND